MLATGPCWAVRKANGSSDLAELAPRLLKGLALGGGGAARAGLIAVCSDVLLGSSGVCGLLAAGRSAKGSHSPYTCATDAFTAARF